jgi:hypothetical protein
MASDLPLRISGLLDAEETSLRWRLRERISMTYVDEATLRVSGGHD